jgi:Na+-driven multidrug efflux pump
MTVASLSWLTVTYLINGYGIVYSAGNGIAAKIRDFSHLFISSMSIGTSAMIAQTLGAKLYDRAQEVMYKAMRLAVGIAAVIVILLELTAPWLAGLFIDDAAVIRVATLNLRIEIVAELFYASFLIYHSLMVGAGHTYMALISSFVNCIVFRMVLAIWFNSLWGITGIFIACMISPASSIPIGWLYTRRGKWRTSLAEPT